MKPFGSLRTQGAGLLRTEHEGHEVVLGGWVAHRRDHGGVAFIDLRDRTGVVQLVIEPSQADAMDAARAARNEYVVEVRGAVRRRPGTSVNPDLATGDIEVAVTRFSVLSPSRTPPFPIEDGIETDEVLRLTHRYLDLRRPELAARITTRSRVVRVIRRVMEDNGFLEIETPILTKSTPEGARDFLVPSRLQPGNVYALPQSPQLFKQLLMVAGMERYYQIARCFRDEDLRADRQPEFTQLDVEASFVVEEDLFSLVEELFVELWREVLGESLPIPFPRMTFDEAMRRYGSDKPDTRYELELADVSRVFLDTEVGVFSHALAAGGVVLGLRLPGGGDMTRREFDELVTYARSRGGGGLAWAVVEESGDLRSALRKFMNDGEVKALVEETGAVPGDALFLVADGRERAAQELLGGVRVELAGRRALVAQELWNFLWVVEPPMFEWDEEGNRWAAVHHPFTLPSERFEEHIEDRPGEVTARAYDIVLNGVELATGSLRIHDPDLQRRVFRLLGITEDEAQEKFGFLLRGLSYGAPPHGGIAPGLDRIVMLMTGASSLRDVVAFPKTQSGSDPMTGAPSPVASQQWQELRLRALPPPAPAA